MEFRNGMLAILLAITILKAKEVVLFNRKLTGVELRPHVLTSEVHSNADVAGYTDEVVKTMLTVVSRRFSRILIDDVNANTVIKGGSGVDGNINGRTVQIAALYNQVMKKVYLSVMVGIYIPSFRRESLNRTLNLALESARTANSIFPGTVEGLFLCDCFSVGERSEIRMLGTWVSIFRQLSSNLGLRIGIQLICADNLRYFNQHDELRALKEVVLSNLDFVICSTEPNDATTPTMALAYSEQFQMNTDRSAIKSINDAIEVMWRTSWQNKKTENTELKYTLENISDFRDYWLQMDKFAAQNNYTVWLKPAIVSNSFYEIGWWNLNNRNLSTDASAYFETISSLPDSIYSSTENERVEDYLSQIDLKFIAVVTGAFLSVVLLAFLAFRFYNKWNSSRVIILTKEEIDEFRNGILENVIDVCDGSLVNVAALMKPYDKFLEIPMKNLEIFSNQILGGGQFGCVFRALVRHQSDKVLEVALKMTKPNSGAPALKGILSEIKILTYLGQHPNIVSIIGAYTAEIHKGKVYVATELCPSGSLKSYLNNCVASNYHMDTSAVPFNDMVRWSYEIACGMEYLEVKDVIHADLAARNVLLSSGNVAKIADFGFSRRLYEYTNYIKSQQEPLPWRWMAIESLKNREFSIKSDVWSFGVTLWEIYSLGSEPYPGFSWTDDFVQNLENGARLSKPRYATTEIFNVMENCWCQDINARLSFMQLKKLTRSAQTIAMENEYTTLVDEVNT